jgi:hypothetical protein
MPCARVAEEQTPVACFEDAYTKRANNNNEEQRSEPCPVSLNAGRRGGKERRDRRRRMRPEVEAEERRKRSVRNASRAH